MSATTHYIQERVIQNLPQHTCERFIGFLLGAADRGSIAGISEEGLEAVATSSIVAVRPANPTLAAACAGNFLVTWVGK